MMSIMERALCYLSERNYSARQVRALLEKEFIHIPNINKELDDVINRLEELSLINEYRLASTLASHYLHKGNRFILRILEQKEINEEVIQYLLNTLPDETKRALEEVAHQLIKDPHKSETDLCRFLSGRHFSGESINSVLQQLQVKHNAQHLKNVA